MQLLNFNELFFKRAAIVFFIGFFVVGCFAFSDYGISNDEEAQRFIGEINYNFIKTGNANEFLTLGDYGAGKYHGPVFEIFLYAAEKIFNVTDSRNIFVLRHGLNFLTFFVATLFFYLLGLKLFKSRGVALLCCMMLVISPRIFAESFYNSKDLPMLCFCIIASYSAFLFIERQTIGWALIHALCCALVLDIRIMGMILPIATLYLYAMQKSKKIIPLLFFISYTIGFTIAFWPVLWLNPYYHFIEAFRQLSHFSLTANILYLGKLVSITNLPWHYLPVSLATTTPVCYLILFLVGLFFAVRNSFVNFSNTLPMQFSLFMFATPILAVIILNSVVYNSWRHVYFVYPYLLLISTYGFTELIKTVKNKLMVKIISFSTLSSILFVCGFMIVNHPFQNVYFNYLAGKNVRQNFELDYWGLSYKQGLEYILANDKSDIIYIANNMGVNIGILPAEDRKRFMFSNDYSKGPKSVKYFLTNFITHPDDYDFGTSVFQVKVGNEKILEVLKLR